MQIWIKQNRKLLFFSTNIIVYLLSQREDFVKAYDLFILFELLAILEALNILFNIFKKFIENFIAVMA
jgi:hypothetical protein